MVGFEVGFLFMFFFPELAVRSSFLTSLVCLVKD